MTVSERINQLYGNPNMVSRTADTTFDDVADAKLLRNFFEVAGNASLILHDRRAADYLQILDLGQTGEQLFLNSISKEGVLFFFAKIIQRRTAMLLSAMATGIALGFEGI